MMAFAAFMMIAVSSIYFFQVAYHRELARVERGLVQLVATVNHNASIASYLENQELAAEVVQGLGRNDIVAGVAIVSTNGMMQYHGDLRVRGDQKLRRFPLTSPFSAETVGELRIHPNRQRIEQRARSAAIHQVSGMVIYSLLMVALLMVLIHLYLTRPIRQLARQLHRIEPGSDALLTCPREHRHNEIGELVADSNHLLEDVKQTLENERYLRSAVESLERTFRLIFEKASGGIALINHQGRLQLFNPSFQRLVGMQQLKELMMDNGTDISDLFEDACQVKQVLEQLQRGEDLPKALDLRLKTSGRTRSSWLHCLFSQVIDDTGSPMIECIFYDISERAQLEKQIRKEADHDVLTQLYNRRAGKREIYICLEEARLTQRQCALLMIDLDHFKPINDIHGHKAGDRVLCEVADRLRTTVRNSDLIIRWGGDEFVILMNQGHGELQPFALAKKILQLLRVGVDLGHGNHGKVGASIGIVIFPDHADELDGLIQLADMAMYQAKQQGRNRAIAYAEGATAEYSERDQGLGVASR
jgi:diguanylate cyclase (GGDEF)-like protein/PAS domain S-box-containing protein